MKLFFFLVVNGEGGEQINDGGLITWGRRRSLEENETLVLAKERTRRKDPLNRFKKYTGGWNIRERHYWAVSSIFS